MSRPPRPPFGPSLEGALSSNVPHPGIIGWFLWNMTQCPIPPTGRVFDSLPCSSSWLDDRLTWLFITMARPSRSLKLLLPRLLEEPPLIDGPGASLPVRSVRMRKGPLLNSRRVNSEKMSFILEGNRWLEERVCALLTAGLPCCSCCCHSSNRGLRPWASGCLGCWVLWLWPPSGAGS